MPKESADDPDRVMRGMLFGDTIFKTSLSIQDEKERADQLSAGCS